MAAAKKSSSPGDSTFDVVIVGAGLAGLSAALHLKDHCGASGITVKVLEARKRVGGRTCTEEHNGTWVDLGAGYVGPTQDHVLELAARYGIESYKVHSQGKNVLALQGQLRTYASLVPPLPLLALLDLNNILSTLEDLSDTVPCVAPWNAPKAEYYDAMTAEQWLCQTAWTKAARSVTEIAIRAVFCAEPCELSMLFVLWYLGCGGGPMRVFETENGAQEQKFVGGTQQLSDRIAAELNAWSPGCVTFDSIVTRVEYGPESAILTTATGTQFKATRVIFATPPPLLDRIVLSPPLPPLRKQLLHRMPLGSIIKTHTYYSTAFWRTLGYSGMVVCDGSLGPISSSFDDTKPDGSRPAIMGFIHSSVARSLSSKTPDERRDLVCKQYARMFNTPEALKPVAYVEKNWMEEEHSAGCYVSLMAPTVLTQFARHLREPHVSLHFAGTETASVWGGYMSGAVESGQRAAIEVLVALGRLSSQEAETLAKRKLKEYFPHTPKRVSKLEKALPGVGTFLILVSILLVAFLSFLIKLFFS